MSTATLRRKLRRLDRWGGPRRTVLVTVRPGEPLPPPPPGCAVTYIVERVVRPDGRGGWETDDEAAEPVGWDPGRDPGPPPRDLADPPECRR